MRKMKVMCHVTCVGGDTRTNIFAVCMLHLQHMMTVKATAELARATYVCSCKVWYLEVLATLVLASCEGQVITVMLM